MRWLGPFTKSVDIITYKCNKCGYLCNLDLIDNFLPSYCLRCFSVEELDKERIPKDWLWNETTQSYESDKLNSSIIATATGLCLYTDDGLYTWSIETVDQGMKEAGMP